MLHKFEVSFHAAKGFLTDEQLQASIEEAVKTALVLRNVKVKRHIDYEDIAPYLDDFM